MQKYKAKKEVIQQVTSKLENLKNGENKDNLGEISAISDADSKLPASKIINKTLFFENWDELLKSHKYSRKEYKNGKWIYYYNKHNNHARMTQCKSPLLTFKYDKTLDPQIQTAMITGQAIDYIENTWLADWEKPGNENKSICKELRNKKIVFGDISYTHLWKQGGNSQGGVKIRTPKNILEHVPYLACAKEMLEDNGVWTESRYEPINKKHSRAVGIIYQTISGIAPAGSPKPYVSVTISQYKYKNGNKGDALYISVVGKDDIKKSLDKKNGLDLSKGGNTSLATKAAFCSTSPKSMPKTIIANSKNKSSEIHPDYNGKNVIHKSFDIKVTDITENNKQQKMIQVQKSLDAIAKNQPFIIKHIAADDSKKYSDITLRITDFDRNKIEKAVHKMAFSLDTDLPAKGEAFNYKAQEELTNRIVKELTEKTKSVYSFVISYFGLPEIRIVSKANLTYKGKVIYDPETGKPIDKKEWEKFVHELEKFLNRNYSGIGEKIVLSAESLGRILERMSKRMSMPELKKKTLEDIEINHRKFDWISESVKNMQDALGETVSRERAARIQIAMDSAALKVTKVTDNMRNDIQQIIVDGVKDRQSKSQISQKLFDKCVGLNRDFQRIADTEIQNTTNNAYLKEEVYNTKEGEKVYFKRFEILDDNTCKKCKKIKGEIALWSDTPLPDEKISDPYAKYAIWDGKSDGDMPNGVVHPYCRGSWFRYYPELD